MKREFLENLKVGEQALPKEIIDAIMAENGRDIEAAKKPFADYDSIKEQLQTAKDGLKAFEGVDVAQLQSKVTELQTQLSDKDKEWQGKMDAMAFDTRIKDAITAAKGRDAAAIIGVLGVEKMEALRISKNQEADIGTALEAMKKEKSYLFDDGKNPPPPYAGGTGTAPMSVGGTMSGVKAAFAARNPNLKIE